jgi:predicted metal-dependent phosphoesterase TrpH
MQYVSAIDAIEAINDAGGVAVLAHPGMFNNYEAIREWVGYGLAGIEAYHPRHRREDVEKSLAYAEEYGLLVTGGSDFHGFYGEFEVEPGCPQLAAAWVDQLEKRAARK